ncbi:MAG TPA: methyltransferase dimerization domain-containing protein, partial [Vicinamibacterales bacterium]
MLPPLPRTDPTPLYRYRDGLYATDLLTAAIATLDLFTYLANEPSSLDTLCRSLAIQARPTDVMLTLFVAMGLLDRDDGVYRVTTLAREHVVGTAPLSLAPYYASFKERPICRDFVAILRTGHPAGWASAGQGEWVEAMKKPEFARQFTAAMDCRGLYLARGVARAVAFKPRHRLLDIAGGSGIYACCLVEEHPHLRATVLERPPVDEVAR